MTTKPKAGSAVAGAIARLKIAQSAYDAVEASGDDTATSLEAEFTACDELVVAPCANEAEFIEKLQCLLARETQLFGSPFDSGAEFVSVAAAAAAYFERTANAKPDPIFALITKHQAARDHLDTVEPCNKDNPIYEAADEIELRKFRRLIVTKPKTLAGIKAFAEHFASYPDLGLLGSEAALMIATIAKALRDIPEH